MTSKKDYEAIAKLLRPYSEAEKVPPFSIACALADYFAQDNPHFDRARFLAACGF